MKGTTPLENDQKVELVEKYVDSKGNARVQGSKSMKGSQHYPLASFHGILRLYVWFVFSLCIYIYICCINHCFYLIYDICVIIHRYLFRKPSKTQVSTGFSKDVTGFSTAASEVRAGTRSPANQAGRPMPEGR